MVMRTVIWMMLAVSLAVCGASLAAGPGMSAPGERAAGEPIVGSDLMTEAERTAHRERLRNAGSAADVERIRAEHHERMRARAAEHGITLPEESRVRGSRMRPDESRSGTRDRSAR